MVEVMYLALITLIPGESYIKRFGSLFVVFL